MSKLGAVIVATVIGMALGLGLVVVLGNGSATEPTLAAATPTPAPADDVAATATESETTVAGTAEAGDDEERASDDAADAGAVGEPTRVRIPAIDVDAELVALGLNDDQSMETPDFGLAGWYDLGPLPGRPGPAVIAAHVDSVDGPDVFFRLQDLEVGDEITVDHATGGSTTFVVEDSEQQLKEELPIERIWNDTDEVVLRLITCGGDFDREERSYRSNVIVYATANAA